MAKLSKMVSTEGLSACGFLRVCGSLKLDNRTTLRLAKKAGFDPAAGTVGIQARKGRDGENVPKIPGDLKARIKSLASKPATGSDDEGSGGEEKATESKPKSEKSGNGKKVKKVKKEKVTADED